MVTIFPHNAKLFFSYFPTQIYAIMGNIINSNDLSTLKQKNKKLQIVVNGKKSNQGDYI